MIFGSFSEDTTENETFLSSLVYHSRMEGFLRNHCTQGLSRQGLFVINKIHLEKYLLARRRHSQTLPDESSIVTFGIRNVTQLELVSR